MKINDWGNNSYHNAHATKGKLSLASAPKSAKLIFADDEGEHEGGVITQLNYSVARTGVNDSLNRLIPAIEATNAMLGQ